MLTKEQIANWRQVFITMGILPIVVNSLPDSDIELMASNFQKRLMIQAEMEETVEKVIAKEKEKVEHRKKNANVSNQYDVIPGFKNMIRISDKR